MARKKLNLSNPGDSTHFGSDDLDTVNYLFDGQDQSAANPIDMNTTWKYRNQKLVLRNPANTFSSTVVNPAVTADSNFQYNVTYDYYIFIDPDDGNKIKARNNRTGTIDSVHATNADVPIQAAIDALSAGSTVGSATLPVPGAGDNINLWTGGKYGAIFVGPGIYKFYTAVILKSNILIAGAGAWSTVFTFPDTLNLGTNAQDIFKSSQWDAKSIGGGTLTQAQLDQGDTGVRLRDFQIYGNARNQAYGLPGTPNVNTATTTVVGGKEQAGTDSWGHGIAYYGSDLELNNLLIHGCSGAGVIIQNNGAHLGSYVPSGSGQYNQTSRVLNVVSWGNGRQGLLLRCPFYVDRYWSYGNGEAGIDVQNSAYFGAAGWFGNMEMFYDGQNHGNQSTVTYDALGFEMRLTGYVSFITSSWIEGPWGPGDSLVMGIEVSSPAGYQLTGACSNNNITNCYFDFPRKSAILMTPGAISNSVQATVSGPGGSTFADFSESKAMTIQGGGRNNINLTIQTFNTGTVNGLVLGRLSPSAGSWNNNIILNSIDNLYAIDWQNTGNWYNSITCVCSAPSAVAQYFIKPAGQTINANNTFHVDGVGQSTVSTKGQNGGLATFSGTGTSTGPFQIAHGLFTTPAVVGIVPNTTDALGDLYVTADATNININYGMAPHSGTNNLKYYWNARVSS